MLRSLKAKFILAFGSLIVLLFTGVGFFLVDSKARELSSDIAQSSQSFATLTVEQFMDSYDLNLEPGNFLAFNSDVQSLIQNNPEIAEVKITSYNGIVLYDSEDERTERYDGYLRTVDDLPELDRVQAQNVSLRLTDGRILYVDVLDDREVNYVNFNEQDVEDLSPRDRISNIVVPYNNTHALTFDVSYEQMQARLNLARQQIVVVAVVGFMLALMLSIMLSVSITNPLKQLKAGALKIASGDFATRVPVHSRDEIGLLATTFNKMAEDLAASTEAMLYQERLQKELELAAQIQTDLLPKDKVELEHMDIAGGLIAATEVGGDAFDYIPMGNGRWMTYIGDVTGHGVPAGIVSSIANAMLYGFRGHGDLLTIAKQMNEVMRDKTSAKVFLTMAMTLWDDTTQELQYLNAGHPPILYYDSAQRKVTEIKMQGMALGLADQLPETLKVQGIQMKPNDVVVMYSDGIPEAMNATGMQYGMQNLKRVVQDAANDLLTAEGIKNAVLSDIVQFIGDGEHTDDITCVVLKRKLNG